MSSSKLRFILVPALALIALGAFSQAQAPQQVGTWASMGPSPAARDGGAAVALADGRTLIAGGTTETGPTDSVAIYDPLAGSVVAAGRLIAARSGHTATLLEDGRVLVVGGIADGAISSDVELFDPAAGTSSLVAQLVQPRTGHAAARIAGNRILIIGGTTTDGAVLKSIEVFDAATGGVTPDAVSQLNEPRTGASATTLIDGRVLVVGGRNSAGDLGSAELYYVDTQTFTLIGNTQLSVPRSGHTALLLPHNAGVLIAGGTAAGAPVATADLFLPAQFPDPFSWGIGAFGSTGAMTTARSSAVGGPAGSAGYAFVAGGGAASGEAYRYATIKTNKGDYAPGERAVITGSGWRPGEEVQLLFQEDPAVHPDYQLTLVADGEGNLFWDQWAPEEHDLNVRFYLTAAGATSRAQTTFTDSRTITKVEIFDPSTSAYVEPPSTISVAGGSSVTVRVTGNTVDGGGGGPASDDWESTGWFVRGPAPSNGEAESGCDSAGINITADVVGAQHAFTVSAPSGPGTYSVVVRAFRSNGCSDNPSNDLTYSGGLIVTAAKVDPTVATTIHKADESVVTAPISLGSTVHDSVSVSGSGATPTGSVTFLFYNNGTCTAPAAATSSSFTLSAGGSFDASTFTQGPLAAGAYSFKAQYGGDANYNAKDGPCEPLTVSQAQLSVSSAVHDSSHANKTNSSVPLGSVVHDTASLTGVVSGFTAPAITFTFYSNSACTGPGTAVANTGADEGVGTSSRSTASSALAAGSYAYKASVAGDSNYLGDDSDCEPFTVGKAQLAVTSAVHDSSHTNKTNSSVALGSVMHDTVSLTGVVSGFTAPAISFTLYTNATCSGSGTSVSNIGTDEGDSNLARSDATIALAAGTYSYKASVPGDDHYLGDDSDCEPFTVSKAQLTVSSAVHDASHADKTNSSVPLGSVVHDTAWLTGVVDGFAAPAITFTFYANGTCSAPAAAAANTGSDEGVSTSSRSAATPALAAGSYSYKASVTGNTNYEGDDTDCEPFTVNKAQLTVNSAVHDAAHTNKTNGSVALGSVVHDSATLSGVVAGFAAPSITFTFYVNGTCYGTGAAVANTGTDGTGVRSADSVALAAGSYSYKASVGANDNYLADDSDCEPFTVDKAQLSVSSAVHDALHADKTNGSVPLASIVHDTASVAGVVVGFAANDVTFTFYANDTCSGTGAAVTNTGVHGTGVVRSADSSALAAGGYAYKASVAGNDNYLGDDSDCEPFTVNPQTTTTTASVPTVSPQYSDKAKLRATVTPHTVVPFEVTGTVYFYIGSSAVTCTAAVPSGSVGNGVIAAADDGVAEIDYQLPDGAGAKTLTACFYSATPNFTNGGGTATLMINRENATFTNVAFTGSIPVSQTSFEVTLDVKELLVAGVEPDPNAGALPGDISKVNAIEAKIVGISTNTQYTASCDTGTGGTASYASVRSFKCTFSNNPFVVDAYTMTLSIPSSNYYFEGSFEDALSVWDPNAGFATGGGTFELDGDRVSFGFSYTQNSKNLRSGFVVVRHLAGGGVCRVKSNNQMNAPAVNGNTVTLSGKGNYSCTDALGVTTASQGNINISAYAEDNDTSGQGADRFWVSNAAAATPNYLKMPLSAAANAILLRGGNVQVPQPQSKR